jgi:hypothetical protein
MPAGKNIKWGALKHQPKFGHLAGTEPIVKPTHCGRFFRDRLIGNDGFHAHNK